MFYYLHGRLSEQVVVTSMPNVRVHDVLSTSANLQGYGIFSRMSFRIYTIMYQPNHLYSCQAMRVRLEGQPWLENP
jgi:hypothetical protein